MSQRNVSGWLPNLIGPIDIQQDATSITPLRKVWNFTGGVTVTDVYVENGDSYTLFDFDGGAAAELGPTVANTDTGAIHNIPSTSGADVAQALRFTGVAPSVTGIASPTGGRELWLIATGGPLVLQHQSASSLAANRIITSTGANVTIPNGSAVLLWYDAASSRWRLPSVAEAVVVASGGGVRVTVSGSTYTVHGVEGSCCPEDFGAVGDGSTDDATALQAMLDALEAGTYTHAEFGAKTYAITTGLVFNASAKLVIRGQGSTSRIYASNAVTGACLLIRNAPDIHLEAFEIYGNATFNDAGANTSAGGGTGQNGIEIGYLGGDGTSRLRVINVTAHHLGGRGLTFAYGADARGPSIIGFSAYECGVGIYALDACAITDFKAFKCGVGLDNAGGGNVFVVGGDIAYCATGMDLRSGSNDTHGSVVGLTIRHCAGNTLRVRGINNGHLFSAVTFYEGTILFDGGNAGEVVFSACIFDCTFYTLAGNALFTGCRFDQAYIATPATDFVTSGGRNIFRDCKDINGTVPSFIGAEVQRQFVFASDVNDTLTAQESVADTLVVTDGTISVSRQITSALAPNTSNRQRIVNDNTYDVTFAWSSGTAVTIDAGYSALVGADSTGTNAKILDPKEVGAGGGEANTASSAGGTASLVKTKAGVDLPFRGISATAPITATQNANDVTIAFTVPGSDQQVTFNDGGALGGDGGLTYNKTTDVLSVAVGVNLGGGTPYSASARIGLPYAATDTIIGVKDSTAADRALFSRTSADTYQMGAGGTYFAFISDWYVNDNWGRSRWRVYSGAGGVNTLNADGTSIGTALPRLGWGKPYASEGLATITGTAGRSLTSSEYTRKAWSFTDSTGGTFTIPTPGSVDETYFVYVYVAVWDGITGTGTLTLSHSGGSLAMTRDGVFRTYMVYTGGLIQIT